MNRWDPTPVERRAVLESRSRGLDVALVILLLTLAAVLITAQVAG